MISAIILVIITIFCTSSPTARASLLAHRNAHQLTTRSQSLPSESTLSQAAAPTSSSASVFASSASYQVRD